MDICRLVLKDAAKIQADDARRENSRRERGEDRVEPLFTLSDVDLVCELFQEVHYDKNVRLGSDLSVQFVDAGHILGSASLVFTVSKPDGNVKVVFSGDLGQWNVPILRDPALIEYADVVFMESTYGDRDHRSLEATLSELEQLIKSAITTGGKILIPTFAVGRAQQVLFHLAEMFRSGVVNPFPIYLDSPMAIAATEIYSRHVGLMDEEARQLNLSGQLRKDLSTLVTCSTSDESMALNSVHGPCVILAGAGMCNAGRILHHLRHSLDDENTIVLIVGFQPRGSLGRKLLEGDSEVKIQGRMIAVRATVKGLGGFSAHAGQSDLLKWLSPMAEHHPRVLLTHGENGPISELSRQIKRRFDITTEVPRLGQPIIL